MVARGLLDHEQDFIDSLHVMEIGMRHFLTKAMTAKANKGKPEVVDENMLQAVSIAEKIAPYRHARLSAVKLAGDPNSPVRFKDDPASFGWHLDVWHGSLIPLHGPARRPPAWRPAALIPAGA